MQNIQAMASLWTRPAIITAYISIWVIYLIDSMQQSNSSALKPYVTSAFQSHSLTPTVDIFSSIIGGVFKLTLVKVLNVFGRPQGYLLSIIFLTMGLVMMAGCNGVKTHAAAQIFYWVGSVSPLYIHTRSSIVQPYTSCAWHPRIFGGMWLRLLSKPPGSNPIGTWADVFINLSL